MNYKSLFNLLYSVRISEACKKSILNSMEFPIAESVEISEAIIPYIEFLDVLAYSNTSEELTNSIIDEVFSELDEAFSEEVYEAYIKVKSLEYISEGEPYIGLTGVRKELEKRDKAESEAKAKQAQRTQTINNFKDNVGSFANSAKEKVKGAVNKVKDWAKNTWKNNTTSNSINYNALRSAIGRKHNENQRKGESDFKNPTTVNFNKTQKTEEPEQENKTAAAQPTSKSKTKTAGSKSKTRTTKNTAKNTAGSKETTQPTQKQDKENKKIEAAYKKTIAKGEKVRKAAEKDIEKMDKEAAQRDMVDTQADNHTVAARRYNADMLKGGSQKSPIADTAPSPSKSNKNKVTDTFVKNLINKEKEGSKKTETPEVKDETSIKNIVKDTKGDKSETEKDAQQKLDLDFSDSSKNDEGSKKTETPEVKDETSSKTSTQATSANNNNNNKNNKKVFIKQGELSQPKNTGKIKGTQTQSVKNMLKDMEAELKNKENNTAKSSPKEESAYEKRLLRDQRAAQKRLQERETKLMSDIEAAKGQPGSEKRVKELENSLAEVRKNLDSYKQPVGTNEALIEAICLLAKSNISESCFVEVMEMAGANKSNATKVMDRYEKDINTSIDDIGKDVAAGKPVDPEKVRKAEELRKKKEHFEQMYKNKFSET